MQYKVYQIQITDDQIDLINEKGFGAVPAQKAKMDMGFSKNDTGAVAGDAFKRGYYTHVSNITADSLEGVFHVGNIGPEENIERLSSMYSISVGDIVEDETGKQSVVASFGFKEVA